MPKGSIELIDAAEAGKKRSNYDTDGDGKVSAAEARAAAANLSCLDRCTCLDFDKDGTDLGWRVD